MHSPSVAFRSVFKNPVTNRDYKWHNICSAWFLDIRISLCLLYKNYSICVYIITMYICIFAHVATYNVFMRKCTVLPRITAREFISFQQLLTRPLNKIDNYYWKKHVLFIICDASDEF